jgi:hypothetical protein
LAHTFKLESLEGPLPASREEQRNYLQDVNRREQGPPYEDRELRAGIPEHF